MFKAKIKHTERQQEAMVSQLERAVAFKSWNEVVALAAQLLITDREIKTLLEMQLLLKENESLTSSLLDPSEPSAVWSVDTNPQTPAT